MYCEGITKEIPQIKVDIIQRHINGEEELLLEDIAPSIDEALKIINELKRQGRVKDYKKSGHFNVLQVL